jgi:hypothetical protein
VSIATRNFTKSFADFQREEIKPAKGVLQEARDFLHERLPKLGTKVRIELKAIIRHSQSPVESTSQTNEEDLDIDSLRSISLAQLSTYVDAEVNKMRYANGILNQKRSNGLRKRAMQLQNFAVTFSRFLQAYSGIVNIFQAVDTQYGNVAFATLSLLFAVRNVEKLPWPMLGSSPKTCRL